MTNFILVLNLIFLLIFFGWLYLNSHKKKYIIALGKFQQKLNLLVDYTDFLALEYGSAEQEAIHLRVKMFPKSIRTLSDYWNYINSLTSAAEVFLIQAEDADAKRKELLRHLAVTKTALVELQRISAKVTRRTSFFAGSIVKIPFNLRDEEPGNQRTRFLSSAISNLTLHREEHPDRG